MRCASATAACGRRSSRGATATGTCSRCSRFTTCVRRGASAKPSGDSAARRPPRSPGSSMARHELKPPIRRPLVDAPNTGHNRWHPGLPPALTVDPGDEIVVDCRDGLDGQITPATLDHDLAAVDLNRGHPLTGPIEVRGADPGDVRKVEIL